jgi:4-hydroxybenzoate polyprenyltransferase
MTALVVRYGRLVRLSHTVFAMPFALAALALAGPLGSDWPRRLVLVVLCMVAARTTAMCVNRLADRKLDAENPRTRSRELVTGEVGVRGATVLAIVSAAAFQIGAALLGRVPGFAALPVLAFLCGYSFAKRFTWATHLWLGAALGLAPIGAAIAWIGRPTTPILVLATGVAAWVAGFDVLYALADEAHDRAHGVHSIPARFGTAAALRIAAALHVGAAIAFALAGRLADAGPAYFAGLAVVAGFLVLQHAVPSIRSAVFKLNGAIGIVFFVAVLVDGALR